MRAVVTIIGEDKVGIIANIAQELAKNNANILDINQTVLGEYFTMTMLVDLENLEISLKTLKEKLNLKGETLGLSIKLQHEDIFRSMHRI